jgi:D-alanyl-D-alanine carboxypeptidase/D-alanyl-D-alanine-endopeptidase (penicillin-binding protein 4)
MSSRNRAIAVALAFACSACQPASTRSVVRFAPGQAVPAVPSSTVTALQHDIDRILAAPTLSRGFWGVLVKSLARDETWYSLNAGKLMMPASAMKVITLAATAETLGWDYRYETRLLVTGPISDGVLHGDLLVVGSGDPSIDDWDGAATRLFAAWADQLEAAGIRTIEGRIVGDDNAFDDDGLGFGWSWDDLVAGFAAGVSALQFNQNVVRVTVTPGATVGAAATVTASPDTGGLNVNDRITTGAANSAATIERRRPPGTSRLELRGSVPLRSRPVAQNVPVDNPTLYFVTALRRALVEAGIDVLGPAVDIDDLDVVPSPTGASPVVTYRSPPFSVLATTLMKFSQNQYAETFLKTLGANGGPGSYGTAEAGRAAVRAVLQSWNIGTAGLIQVDGSGLSRYNYVTPDTLVTILTHVDRDERLRERYEATLPIAGRDSTLASRMKGTAAEGNARIKDGAMANVRAMTGYVRTADGEKLVFAILANNFDGPASTITGAADAIVVRLATFRR